MYVVLGKVERTDLIKLPIFGGKCGIARREPTLVHKF